MLYFPPQYLYIHTTGMLKANTSNISQISYITLHKYYTQTHTHIYIYICRDSNLGYLVRGRISLLELYKDGDNEVAEPGEGLGGGRGHLPGLIFL